MKKALFTLLLLISTMVGSTQETNITPTEYKIVSDTTKFDSYVKILEDEDGNHKIFFYRMDTKEMYAVSEIEEKYNTSSRVAITFFLAFWLLLIIFIIRS
jgi:hypothetical protein